MSPEAGRNTEPELSAAAQSSAAEWNPEQQEVLDRLNTAQTGHGPLLVYGAPGTGKTALAEELALRFLAAGHDARRLLVLSPTRTSAARLRERIESRWAAESSEAALSDQPSRSFASYAFWLLGEARRRRVLTFASRTPRLLSGAEQDRIIRDILAEMDAADAEHWPGSLAEAATTDGFRKEIRELIDRASEHGLTPDALDDLGRQHWKPEWQAGAEVYRRYRERLDSPPFEDAFDPAGLIDAACALLENHPDLLAAERERLRLLVVDDLQEAGASTFRLLRLIGAGQQAVAFANPDAAVQGFRGARPDRLRTWTAQQRPAAPGSMQPDPEAGLPGGAAETAVLRTSYRLSSEIAEVYTRTVQRIGAVGPPALRRPALSEQAEQGPAESAGARAEAVTAGSGYVAEQAVVAELLERYDAAGVPFAEMAVIARNGAAAHQLGQVLRAHGIPVVQPMSEFVLKREPAVAPLLHILELVTADTVHPLREVPAPDGDDSSHRQSFQVPLEDLIDLLGSRYGDTDPLKQRRLRQLLRQAERRLSARQNLESRGSGGAAAPALAVRDSDELLLEAGNNPDAPVLREVAENFPGIAYGLARIGRMVRAARAVVEDNPQGAGPEEVLWAAWEAAAVSERWAEATRGTGWDAERADRDLDAVLALFHAAERFADQNPRALAASFADHMNRLELPMDTLAEGAAPEDAVHILTPATAAGREFDTVILTGLQEGTWPNLKPRGQLLSTTALVDVVEHGGLDAQGTPEASSALVKRLHVLQDEYRLFAAAVSRARSRLFAVAVEAQEEQPSMFLDLITSAGHRPPVNQLAPEPITGPALVAQLRRHLETTGEDPAEAAGRDAAAQALAVLAEHRIAGADPRQWWGLQPLSTEEPILDVEEPVRVSPSSVGGAVADPLGWFTAEAGGTQPTDFSRMLGTLIHEVAEHHPTETEPDVLTEALERRWHSLGLEPGWQAEAEWARAQDMLRQLTDYHREANALRELVHVELKAAAETTLSLSSGERRVILSGMIDRIEKTPDGTLWVIDLKTGRHAASAKETARHAQLGTYQLLLAHAELPEALRAPLERAALLYVGVNKNPTTREQEAAPLENPHAWPHRLLHSAAEVMTGSSFDVRRNPGQSWGGPGVATNPLSPLRDENKQVTQP
ncbi:ATP-dependent helicase [Nesterenkonia flava]|uniref:DNA 3'-5' helicase n=1 Tax=Nesterenkonia flava TaxID=469799 RepID=A0ABU1FQC7_9MICC|nr:PD-(D/E)XK nuclease family protein [Nesterenkonia flava]MDR5710844.1 PD-(D/E)XK nuclease family protein [Nesterenkonia flava]